MESPPPAPMRLDDAVRRGVVYRVFGRVLCTSHGEPITGPERGVATCPAKGCPVRVWWW